MTTTTPGNVERLRVFGSIVMASHDWKFMRRDNISGVSTFLRFRDDQAEIVDVPDDELAALGQHLEHP